MNNRTFHTLAFVLVALFAFGCADKKADPLDKQLTLRELTKLSLLDKAEADKRYSPKGALTRAEADKLYAAKGGCDDPCAAKKAPAEPKSDKLGEALAKLQEQVAQGNQAAAVRFNELEGRVDGLEAGHQDLEGRYASLSAGQSDLDGRVKNLEDGAAAVNESLEALRAKAESPKYVVVEETRTKTKTKTRTFRQVQCEVNPSLSGCN